MAIVVIDFLMTNVFVGVVIDNYNEIKNKETGAAMITDSQKQWLDMMRLLLAKSPELMMEEPAEKYRKPFFFLVESKNFEKTLTKEQKVMFQKLIFSISSGKAAFGNRVKKKLS